MNQQRQRTRRIAEVLRRLLAIEKVRLVDLERELHQRRADEGVCVEFLVGYGPYDRRILSEVMRRLVRLTRDAKGLEARIADQRRKVQTCEARCSAAERSAETVLGEWSRAEAEKELADVAENHAGMPSRVRQGRNDSIGDLETPEKARSRDDPP